jgi:FkbM family methyltransferase
MMSFVYYSQNKEDVVLFRLFGKEEKGFYIDVGAQHPKVHSVTHAFYKRGWRGVNVEPSDEYFPLLEQARPRDINIHALVSEVSGAQTYFQLSHSGLSTTNGHYAQQGINLGFSCQEKQVSCTTLDDICFAHKITKVRSIF